MEYFLEKLGTAGAVAAVVLLFSLAIFIHEFGHYLAARILGMKVDAFSIGFGPAIWKKKIGGIEYKISWFLFGGYVALPQLDPAGMDKIQGKNSKKDGGESGGAKDASGEETPPPLPDAPPWKRIIVAAAGPFGNVVLAAVIACILPFTSAEFGMAGATAGSVLAGSPADKAGIFPGDRIISIGGEPVSSFNDIRNQIAFAGASKTEIEFERAARVTVAVSTNAVKVAADGGGDAVETVLAPILTDAAAEPSAQTSHPSPAPARSVRRAGDSTVSSFFASGRNVEFDGDLFPVPEWNGADLNLSFELAEGESRIAKTQIVPLAVPGGGSAIGILSVASKAPMWMGYRNPAKQLAWDCKNILLVLKKLVTPKSAGNTAKAVSGPVGIGRVLYKTVRKDFWGALGFLRFLCINLALLNLLPIPVLDGGHIVFALFEAVTRRKPNRKIVEWTTAAFAFLVIGLMLLLVFTDSKRWIDAGMAESKAQEEQVGRFVTAE